MEPTDQLQIVIQYFVEVSALFSCFCQYHRQMQGYHANVEASHKYRFVSIKRRVHTALFVPGRQKCSAAHGGDDLTVFLVHTCDIALSGQAQPVGIHGLGRAFHAGFKYIFQRLTGTV